MPTMVNRDTPWVIVILTDPRVRAVAWKDLAELSRVDTARELALSLPWLAL